MDTERAHWADHLEELRKRLFFALVPFVFLVAASFFFSDFLVEVVSAPIKRSIPALYFLSPYEAFVVKLNVSLVSGIVLSSPILFIQLWKFVSPGLYAREQKVILPLAVISTVLFVIGVLFAYFIVIPFALQFFLGFQTDTLLPLISFDSYISFFLSLLVVFGVVFDVPVILVGLIALRVIGSAFLSRQRKIVVILIFTVAAILTPTVDIVTQCLLAVPLWLLFELSIVIGKQVEKRRSRD